MTFTVTLTTDNAAFQDRPDEVEVARILTRVANRLLDGERDGKCLDSNGNAVGAFGFHKGRDAEMMLKTEMNTPKMERRILKAARAGRLMHLRGRLVADFEHGQWWVTDKRSGAQWSVVDAAGGQSVDGFDFELVTEGDEELL